MEIQIPPPPGDNKQQDEFDAVPPGAYESVVLNVVLGEAQSGTGFAECVFKILAPTHEGARVGCRFYLTYDARWKLKNFFDAIDTEWPEDGRLETDELHGKRLQIVVQTDNNGRSEVVRFKKSSESTKPIITDDDVPF